LPESNVSKNNEGEVLAVGPGLKTKTGDMIEVPVSVGDRVLLPEYGGLHVKMDGEDLYLFSAPEILAKFGK
jgi:chaperonin GroES